MAGMLVDDLGAEVALARPPRRVVSLVPSLTESLAVSRPELLVGATDWCSRPVGLLVPRVRGTKNPDLRRITELAPDLVVCNQEENRELDVRRLRAAGIAVWVSRISSLDMAFASLRRLFADILGGPVPGWLSRAEQLWQVPAHRPPLRVVVPIWRDPWMVVGGQNFASDLLGRLGLRNAFGTRPRYPQVELADIRAARADLVLLPDEPYPFSATDGPDQLAGLRTELVSGRLLTWYGPSLLAARAELERLLAEATSSS